MNISEVQQLGEEWNSTVLLEFSSTLSANTTDANVGELHGNRMFFANDYMVSSSFFVRPVLLTCAPKVTRGPGYVTTVRMYSNRTINTECLNSQNVWYRLLCHVSSANDISAFWLPPL
jgi:hypothetical protein